jgi:hypothetical protein
MNLAVDVTSWIWLALEVGLHTKRLVPGQW